MKNLEQETFQSRFPWISTLRALSYLIKVNELTEPNTEPDRVSLNKFGISGQTLSWKLISLLCS